MPLSTIMPPEAGSVCGNRLSEAVSAWRAIVGQAEVQTDTRALGASTCQTFANAPCPSAIIRPKNAEQVRDCIRIAFRFGIPLHPVSTGLNWGYGSASPPQEESVVLNLSRLGRILGYDPKLGTVDLEPGVTQGQLAKFLQEQGGHHWIDATGASPHASVIGTTLERGFGHTPFADHWSHICNLHVVMADGTCIQTGFGAMPGARAAACHRWGAGPDLDGLFAQSGLGVVTRLTTWLMPVPERTEAFFFSCDNDGDLAQVIEALRPLRIDGTLRSALHIANPWKALAAAAPGLGSRGLDQEQLLEESRRMGMGAWNGSGCLYGSVGQVADARRRLRRALAGKVGRLTFVDESRLRWAQRLARPLSRLMGMDLVRILELIVPVHRLMRGQPGFEHQRSTWWGKPGEPPAVVDPDANRCGLLWWSPVVPLDGDQIALAARTSMEILTAHRFLPQVVVNLPYPRSALVLATITYDRDRPGEDLRAEACLGELRKRFDSLGYHPYRYGIQGLAHWRQSLDPAYARTLDRIADAIDPCGILGQKLARGSRVAPRRLPT